MIWLNAMILCFWVILPHVVQMKDEKDEACIHNRNYLRSLVGHPLSYYSFLIECIHCKCHPIKYPTQVLYRIFFRFHLIFPAICGCLHRINKQIWNLSFCALDWLARWGSFGAKPKLNVFLHYRWFGWLQRGLSLSYLICVCVVTCEFSIRKMQFHKRTWLDLINRIREFCEFVACARSQSHE